MRLSTRITETNGNSTNRIIGSRIRLYSFPMGDTFNPRTAKLEAEIYAPRNGKFYCQQHPGGWYGKRYQEMLNTQAEITKGEIVVK